MNRAMHSATGAVTAAVAAAITLAALALAWPGFAAMPSSAAGESPPAAGLLTGSAGPRMHPEIQSALDLRPDQPMRAIVHLRQTRLSPSAAAGSDAAESDREAARGAYLDALRAAHADASAGVMAYLGSEARAGRVTRQVDLWLADAVAITADPAVIQALAGRPEVRWITPDPALAVEPWSVGAPPGSSVGLPSGPPRAAAPADPAGEPPPDAAGELPADPATPAALWNIQMIHADAVWQRLGIDGSGVTVAIVDTGVDYHHPLLRSRYRGFTGEDPPRNGGNWWCSGDDAYCGQGTRYPVDDAGHGTHVAGTIVAGAGIGVAPGARWIAARTCSGRDCFFSAIVAAIQWMLERAPEDQPDVLNFSLGSTSEFETALYQPVFNRLYAADLVVVAASGNSAGGLQAPANFTSTIGVGSVTDTGDLWPNSARGTSPWGEAKPDLVAPGTGITSTVPGGGLWRKTGTSMAAPHVSGVVALLLQARPGLTPAQVKAVLTAHARPLTPAGRDPASGWGLVDAYAAVASVTDVGTLGGKVTRAGDRGVIPWAHVVVADEVGAQLADVAVNPADGSYSADLHPGRYLIVAKAFGFRSQTQRVTIQEKLGITLDFQLALDEPMGTFRGRLIDAATGAPLAGEIHLEGVPFAIPSDEVFGFSQNLPPQTYNLRIERFGYRVRTDVVKIAPGETLTQDYALEATPKILLVDGDAWDYNGAGEYFKASLDRLGYVHHLWRITNSRAGPGKPGGPPLAKDLAAYDIVIWSNAITSPNFVMGAWELLAYLEQGGRLFLSGQDALCYDAGRDALPFTCNENAPPHPYLTQKLRLRVTSDHASGATVAGSPGGPLAGITLTLGGAGSMANQATPDKLAPTDGLSSRLIATYAGGEGAAAMVDTCVAHRAIAFGFGFEGIAGAETRDRVMARVIDALAAPPPEHGLYVRPDATGLSRRAGATADYTITLHSTGSAVTEFDVSTEGAAWPVEVWEGGLVRPLSGPLRLGACGQVPFVVRVRVPAGSSRGATDTVRVSVRARSGDAATVIPLITRTPAPVLVVDGDYDRSSEKRYLDGLRAAGVAYDIWELGLLKLHPTMPTTRTLADYPAVVWFSGYDILRPNGSLNRDGQRALDAYLRAGGRLLFSSEDYLHHWGQTPYREDRLFHHEFLGVGGFVDDGGDAHAGPLTGVDGSVLAGLTDCRLPLLAPDMDPSDRLIPRTDRSARPALLDVFGEPVATQFEATGVWRTLFLAFDAGRLDKPCADAIVARAMDWFSPLSSSSLALVDASGQPETRRTFASGDLVRLRLRLANTGPRPVDDAALRWELPAGSALESPLPPGPGWAWDPAGRVLTWQGRLARFESLDATVALRLDGGLPAGTVMRSTARLGGEGIPLARPAEWRVNAADLGASSKSVPDDERVRRHGERVKFIINVVNQGTERAPSFGITDTLPAGLVLVPGSLTAEGGQATVDPAGGIVWQGPELAPGQTASLTYRAQVATWRGGWLLNQAWLTEASGERHALSAAVFARPELFFPWLGWQKVDDP